MSFLALIYLAGLSAIGLPILFHLIRRAPRGRVPFSSLMFLKTSPPRVTRRSRIENWPLLLLRALAVILLVLAFMRPFIDSAQTTALDSSRVMRKVILLDTSASMRRGDLWAKAGKQLKKILAEAGSRDRIAVMTFDTRTKMVLGFDGWFDAAASQRAALVAGQLKAMEIAPGWAGTNTAAALVRAVEALEEDESHHKSQVQSAKQIVLISDLQDGSRLQGLEAYEWPDDVQLLVKPIDSGQVNNASIEVLPPPPDGDERLRSGATVRVRVSNSADSQTDQFKLRWSTSGSPPKPKAATTPKAAPTPKAPGPDTTKDAKKKRKQGVDKADGNDGKSKSKQPAKAVENNAAKVAKKQVDPPGVSVRIHVPAGQSRDVKLARPGNIYRSLNLSGDGQSFDNRAYSAYPPPRRMSVVYLGSDSPDNPDEPLYYLNRAYSDTSQRIVKVIKYAPREPLTDLPADLAMVVVADVLSKENQEKISSLLAEGMMVLILARRVEMARTIGALSAIEKLSATEAVINDYAMLGRIDFDHDLFTPFVEPRFRDFTNIRFMKYRVLSADPGFDHLDKVKVLMSFATGDPMLIEAKVGRGACYIFASGWHPADSQLALLASKFLPIMNRMIEIAGSLTDQPPIYYVGVPVKIADLVDLSDLADNTFGPLRIKKPGTDQPVVLKAGQTTFTDTQLPGIYTVITGKAQQQFAVNLDPAESRLKTLDSEKFASLKVQMAGKPVDLELKAKKDRQLLSHELEQKHKIWRVLVIASLAVLIVETWLAGRLARRITEPEGATS